MHDFGIKAVLRTALTVYETCARASGRTTATLDRLRDGDVLIVSGAHPRNAHRLRQAAKERGLDVKVMVCDSLGHAMEARRGNGGRFIVDHNFVEQSYVQAIALVERELDGLNPAEAQGEPGNVQVHHAPYMTIFVEPGPLTAPVIAHAFGPRRITR